MKLCKRLLFGGLILLILCNLFLYGYIFLHDNMDKICKNCIALLRRAEERSGFSYEQINVVLFIILEPLFILFFTITTYIALITKNEKIRTAIKIIFYVSFIIGLLISLFLGSGYLALECMKHN